MPYHNKQQVRASVSASLKSKKTPKGFHRMPDGRLMKGSSHPKNNKTRK